MTESQKLTTWKWNKKFLFDLSLHVPPFQFLNNRNNIAQSEKKLHPHSWYTRTNLIIKCTLDEKVIKLNILRAKLRTDHENITIWQLKIFLLSRSLFTRMDTHVLTATSRRNRISLIWSRRSMSCHSQNSEERKHSTSHNTRQGAVNSKVD